MRTARMGLDAGKEAVVHWKYIKLPRKGEGAAMVKRLTRHGNSLALVVDRGVLDLLEIDADTPLSLTTDGKCLIVTPVRDPQKRERFRSALEAVNRRYGRAFKRLAH